MFFRIIFSVICILVSVPAAGMDIIARVETPGHPFPNRLYLHMSGEISNGDAQELQDDLARYDHISFREFVIYLDSPGGSLMESLEIAKILRSRAELVRTHVGGIDNMLTPIEGIRVMGLIDSYRRVLELTDIETRLHALEHANRWL